MCGCGCRALHYQLSTVQWVISSANVDIKVIQTIVTDCLPHMVLALGSLHGSLRRCSICSTRPCYIDGFNLMFFVIKKRKPLFCNIFYLCSRFIKEVN